MKAWLPGQFLDHSVEDNIQRRQEEDDTEE